MITRKPKLRRQRKIFRQQGKMPRPDELKINVATWGRLLKRNKNFNFGGGKSSQALSASAMSSAQAAVQQQQKDAAAAQAQHKEPATAQAQNNANNNSAGATAAAAMTAGAAAAMPPTGSRIHEASSATGRDKIPSTTKFTSAFDLYAGKLPSKKASRSKKLLLSGSLKRLLVKC